MSSNAIAIEVAESTTGGVYLAGTSIDLTVMPEASASAVWAVEDDQYGIAYARGANVGFIAVEGVTVIINAAPVYNPGDIAVINAIIDNNGLNWTKAPEDGSAIPVGWTGIIWSDDPIDKRITRLDLYANGLSGEVDVSGLTEMEWLDCGCNELTMLDVGLM